MRQLVMVLVAVVVGAAALNYETYTPFRVIVALHDLADEWFLLPNRHFCVAFLAVTVCALISHLLCIGMRSRKVYRANLGCQESMQVSGDVVDLVYTAEYRPFSVEMERPALLSRARVTCPRCRKTVSVWAYGYSLLLVKRMIPIVLSFAIAGFILSVAQLEDDSDAGAAAVEVQQQDTDTTTTPDAGEPEEVLEEEPAGSGEESAVDWGELVILILAVVVLVAVGLFIVFFAIPLGMYLLFGLPLQLVFSAVGAVLSEPATLTLGLASTGRIFDQHELLTEDRL